VELKRRARRRVERNILITVELEVGNVTADPEVGSIVLQLSVRQLSRSTSTPATFVWLAALMCEQERVHVVTPLILVTVTLQAWFIPAKQAIFGTLASPALQASAAAPFWVWLLMALQNRHSDTVA